MKRIVLAAVLTLLSISAFAQDWAGLYRYAPANKEVIASGVKPKAVFFGDSITDFWYSDNAAFFDSNNFVNRGFGGQTTTQMLSRVRPDVIELHPKYMVFLAGINDIAQNTGFIEVEDAFRNYVSIVELARNNGIKPIICTLFPVETIGWNPGVGNISAKVEEFNSLLKAYAKKNHIKCFEYFQDIDKSAGRLPVELSADSIHPTHEGYQIMEKEILRILK